MGEGLENYTWLELKLKLANLVGQVKEFGFSHVLKMLEL